LFVWKKTPISRKAFRRAADILLEQPTGCCNNGVNSPSGEYGGRKAVFFFAPKASAHYINRSAMPAIPRAPASRLISTRRIGITFLWSKKIFPY
jgi:hypothetical protein